MIAFVAASPQNETKAGLLKKGFDAEIFEEEYLNLNLYFYNLKKTR